MTINYVHRDLIVPVSHVETARNVASAWHSGQGMFISPLASESDPTTITHYISTGKIGDDVAPLLDDPAAFTAEINQRLGTSYSEAEMSDLRDAMDISSEGPEAAKERLGLVAHQHEGSL